MKNRINLVFIILGLSGLFSCGGQSSKTVKIKNETGFYCKDAFVQVDLKKIGLTGTCEHPVKVMINNQEIPSQVNDGSCFFLIDIKPNGTMEVIIQNTDKEPNYTQRAHAELSRKEGGHYEGDRYIGGKFTPVSVDMMPPNHVDHDTYYRYEGPGWESDKVAYRYYLDARNCIDIFGKKVSNMVLPNVGLDDSEAYLQMSDWGGDIFKVGTSLGIGSVAAFVDETVVKVSITDSVQVRIVKDGPILAEIQTNYLGWKIGDQKFDLQSHLSIRGGSRLTRHELMVSGELNALASGLVKHEGCNFLKSNPASCPEWNYIALWGKQSLAGDNLGTALFFKKSNLIELREDDLNHLVILESVDSKLEYYFAAVWEGEPGGIKTEQAFIDYLNMTIIALDNPVKVIY